MENKEWNRDEWQGKRQDQVEYSNKVGSIFAILILITLLLFVLS